MDSVEIVRPLDIVPGVSLGAGFTPDGLVAVEPLTLVGGNVGYILPVLNNRLALETLVAIPQKIKLVATGSLANESILPTVFGIPTGIPPLGASLAEVSAISPVLTAVYRLPTLGRVTPVVGAGVAALFGADVEITNPLLQRYIGLQFDVAPTLGAILQAGADIHVWGQVRARVDLKYLSLSTTVTIDNIQVKTGLPLIGDVDVGTVVVKASAHAWLAQLGVGFDFDL